MGWFSKKKPEPEDDDVTPVYTRLASPEFVSGLTEIAEVYAHREMEARKRIGDVAKDLAGMDYFSHGDLDRMLGKIRHASEDAALYRGLASEVRDWIRDYEHRGRRPPYLPAEPPSLPVTPAAGGE